MADVIFLARELKADTLEVKDNLVCTLSIIKEQYPTVWEQFFELVGKINRGEIR